MSFALRSLSIFPLCLILICCAAPDCSEIDLKLLAETKFQENVKTYAVRLEDFPDDLHTHLNKNQRLIFRCRTEDDFLRDAVLPGVLLWASDSWGLRTDTSALGKIFAEHRVSPWERTRVAGILYHRFLTKIPFNTDALLTDASIRSQWFGRVKNAGVLKQIEEPLQKELGMRLLTTDSLLRRIGKKELTVMQNRDQRKKWNELTNRKKDAFNVLDIIGRDVQDGLAAEKDITLLTDKEVRTAFANFGKMSAGQKLVLIERTKSGLLEKEGRVLDSIISAAGKSREIKQSVKEKI